LNPLNPNFERVEEHQSVKTITPSADPKGRKWYVVDAEGQILGRLASDIAHLLRGKHKPEYTPHLDLGDHIVVVNASKIGLSGQKLAAKEYDRYTGFPGGLRTTSMEKVLQEKPERVLMYAVRGMLPKNRLGKQLIRKLRIYKGPEHPHQAQLPEVLPQALRRS
jgi:large subunit ribosomal protein L13